MKLKKIIAAEFTSFKEKKIKSNVYLPVVKC